MPLQNRALMIVATPSQLIAMPLRCLVTPSHNFASLYQAVASRYQTPLSRSITELHINVLRNRAARRCSSIAVLHDACTEPFTHSLRTAYLCRANTKQDIPTRHSFTVAALRWQSIALPTLSKATACFTVAVRSDACQRRYFCGMFVHVCLPSVAAKWKRPLPELRHWPVPRSSP